jgi:hypothetical protein
VTPLIEDVDFINKKVMNMFGDTDADGRRAVKCTKVVIHLIQRRTGVFFLLSF